jgi:hypothetical protein
MTAPIEVHIHANNWGFMSLWRKKNRCEWCYNKGMGKRTFQLTETEIKAFKRREQESQRVDELKGLQAVRLYGIGYAMSSIREMLNCAEHSVRLWVLDYQRGGLEALLSQYQNSAQNARLLNLQQEAELKERLR